MRRYPFLKAVLILSAAVIIIPLFLLLLWCVTVRWPWPQLFPKQFSLRAARELFFGAASLPRLLGSSVALAGCVAVLGTTVGLLTARATELYEFPGKTLIRFGSFLPLLVPGTVFAMGIQVTLLRIRLADTVTGVVLVHLISALPYCVTIMTDLTRAVGDSLEEQDAVLGASPGRAFFHTTLPLLLPGILSSMSMAFIISYSQYFTTLIVGGGKVRTLALVLVPYIQSGDRTLSAIYAAAFVLSAILVFALFEWTLVRSRRWLER